MKRFSRLARLLIERRRSDQLGVSVATASATGAVLSAIFPPATVFCIMGLVIAHEGAHYAAARGAAVKAATPVFFLWPLGATGMTAFVKPDDGRRFYILAAGPVAGLVFLGVACLYAPVLRVPATLLSLSEGWSGIGGGDGKKLRELRRRRHEWFSPTSERSLSA